jgi:hypothetical protein
MTSFFFGSLIGARDVCEFEFVINLGTSDRTMRAGLIKNAVRLNLVLSRSLILGGLVDIIEFK